MTDRGWLMPARRAPVPETPPRKSVAHGGGAGAPIHAGAGFGFRTSGGVLRDGARGELSPAVLKRLQELAGTVIDWWVEYNEDDRLESAFFGDKGLALSAPAIGSANPNATEISCYVIDPATLRSRAVTQRPAANWLRQAAPGSGLAALETSGGAGELAVTGGGAAGQLSAGARGVLGNLPAEAQQLMQAPFHARNEILGCDWHYEGSGQQINVFMMYLAGAKDITVATGTSTIPGKSTTQAARWSLQVYRARVVRRIGRNTWIRG